MTKPFAAALVLGILLGPAQAGIIDTPWGRQDGQPVRLYTLTNASGTGPSGMAVRITNYGGVIVSLRVPGRDGKMANVVQGFDSLADYTSPDYIAAHGHYGGIIGRYANRIKGGRITLDGKTWSLDLDEQGNTDHGGAVGYHRRVFTATAQDGPEPRLVLTHTDPDGFMGFPGTVRVTVTYTLLKSNTLRIDYRARTDKPTVINLTNHSYFNLAGEGPGTVDAQVLQMFADHYAPVTDKGGAVPTGEIRATAGSAYDFSTPSPIGPHINAPEMGRGIDNTYVINGTPGTLRIAARMRDPGSGRVLEVWTTQPGVQVYSANGVHAKVAEDKHYVPHGAMSFQTQHYPDSPNHPNFPSTELRPGKPFHEVTEFRFSVAH